MLFSSYLHPSGSVNRIMGPKQVILDASGESWVEQSPLGVRPPSTNYPGSNSFSFICDLFLYLYFVYEVCLVPAEV